MSGSRDVDTQRRAVLLGSCAALFQTCVARDAKARATPETTSPETTSMEEQNLAAFRTWLAAFNAHDAEHALAFIAADATNHGRAVGRTRFAAIYDDLWTTFPDLHHDIQEIVAAGDQIAFRSIFTGTHRGVGKLPLNGAQLVGVPPTGKHMATRHIHWYTMKNGQIVEHRANRDDVGMLRQLGMMPEGPSPELPPLNRPIAHRNVAGGQEQTRNLDAMRRWRAAIARRDLHATLDLVDDGVVVDGRPLGGDMQPWLADEFRTFAPTTASADIAEMIAVDDCVVARTVKSYVHEGVSDGLAANGVLAGVAPTRLTFTRQDIHWCAFRDGRIVRQNTCRDDMGMLTQLRLVPPPPQP